MNLEATPTVTTMEWDKLGRVYEIISCEESKKEFILADIPHISTFCWYFVKNRDSTENF